VNLKDTQRCYTFVCGQYGIDPSDVAARMWHETLEPLSARVAWEATKAMCNRKSPFPPRPGEIAAEARQMMGVEPPSVEAAFGLWRSGRKNRHPAIAEAAARCQWDPQRSEPKAAWYDFRAQYEAVLWEHREADYEPVRAQLGIEAPKVAEVVALPTASSASQEPPCRDGLSQVRRIRDELRNRDGDGAA
jgi:hypothetical protein